jgi:hypothetical protein
MILFFPFSPFSSAIRPFISQSSLNVVRHPAAGATSGNKMAMLD